MSNNLRGDKARRAEEGAEEQTISNLRHMTRKARAIASRLEAEIKYCLFLWSDEALMALSCRRLFHIMPPTFAFFGMDFSQARG